VRMSKFTCPKCGHEIDGLAPVSEELLDWREIVGPELAKKMERKFTAVDGRLRVTATVRAVQGEPAQDLDVRYRTLFLSAVERIRVLDLVSQKTQRTSSDLFRERHLPALQMLDKKFEILGCLAPPTLLSLAMSDLIAPRAVFAFVTVVDSPDLADRLREVGLEGLLNEGAVDTLGGIDWFKAVSPTV
jgi:hypothetical protein